MNKLKLPHPLFLIVGIGFLLYARSLAFEYTNFDDNTLIQENQNYISHLSNITDAFSKTVFITGSDVFYRPVETIWFILNSQISGDSLSAFHASSLLLHFLSVYLIFVLLKCLNNSEDTSLFLSLVFLVHPLFTQAVSWVPGVVDILVAVFSVSSFIFFLDFLESQHRKHFVLSILFFTLAIYTKETAVGIIAVCLFYLHFIKKENLVSYNKKVFFIGWLVVLAVWFMMRDSALKGQPHKVFSGMIISIGENIPGMIQYIGKILLPFNLSVMPVMKDTSFVFGILALVLFSVAIYFSKQKSKNVFLFGIVWFVVFLLPTFIHTSEFRIQQFYEHRMYLPMIGVLFFVSEIDWLKNFSVDNKYYRIAGMSILVLFFIVAFRHERTFSDTKSFLDNAVKMSPSSSLAHRNLGIYYQDKASQDKNLLKDAAEEYLKSLELNPHENDLHNNLGVIYDTWGKKDSAEKEYLTEVQLNPVNPQALHNLGVIYAERNENDKAEMYFKKAIAINPNASTYQQLALLYKKMGRQKDFEKIAMMFQQKQQSGNENQRAVPQQNAPADPVTLAQQLMQSGKTAEAENVFKNILAKDSADVKATFNLGLIYYSEKRLPDAELLWRKSVKMDSTYTDAFNNLAICLAQQGKNSEAEIVLKKVITSNPNYLDGYFNIANFYARNGKGKEAQVYISLLKQKGITKQTYVDRGIKLSPELEKLFDEN